MRHGAVIIALGQGDAPQAGQRRHRLGIRVSALARRLRRFRSPLVERAIAPATQASGNHPVAATRARVNAASALAVSPRLLKTWARSSGHRQLVRRERLRVEITRLGRIVVGGRMQQHAEGAVHGREIGGRGGGALCSPRSMRHTARAPAPAPPDPRARSGRATGNSVGRFSDAHPESTTSTPSTVNVRPILASVVIWSNLPSALPYGKAGSGAGTPGASGVRAVLSNIATIV